MNPADWASREGQNYVENSQISCECELECAINDAHNSACAHVVCSQASIMSAFMFGTSCVQD